MRGHYHCLRTGCYFVTNITTKLPWHIKKHEKAERRAANGFKYFTKREECGRLGTYGQGGDCGLDPWALLTSGTCVLPPLTPWFVKEVTDSQSVQAQTPWECLSSQGRCPGPHCSALFPFPRGHAGQPGGSRHCSSRGPFPGFNYEVFVQNEPSTPPLILQLLTEEQLCAAADWGGWRQCSGR